jgi:Alpha-L-arabinofuranosidase C-terminal domain
MFKGFRVGAVTLSALMLAAASNAQSLKATLSVQLDKPLHAVSPTLYGLMTEEINYSCDGGLYAEMVRNRTFYDHGWSGIPHWDLVHDGNVEATMTFDGTDGPSESLPRSLLYLKLVNANSTPQPLEINLGGAGKIGESGILVTLGAADLAETNTISAPTRIVPVKTTLKDIGSTFSHTVPGYSVQVLEISAQ